MSRENVEIVRRVCEEARHDPAALWDIVDHEATWVSGENELPDGAATYHGPAGVREFLGRWIGSFDDWTYELGEVVDGGEAVAFHMRQSGRGKRSGVLVTNEFWQVWTFREGKVIHRTRHPDRAAALDALGR